MSAEGQSDGRLRRAGWDLLTFSVVAEAHLRLAQADGVLALAHAIERLQLGLVDALRTEG
jgi:hypothetical protein